jgi:hypothetical protein
LITGDLETGGFGDPWENPLFEKSRFSQTLSGKNFKT